MAPSPEAFLALRATFATSLATFNAAGWVLGIGDRHLENALLSHSDGRLVPIDFGHAFGSATQFLVVPELAPMRLTRQLRGVLRPLGTGALLAPTMINVLSALKDNRDVLMRALDVFVRDPISDWSTYTRMLTTWGKMDDTVKAGDENEADGFIALPDKSTMTRDQADGLSAHARARKPGSAFDVSIL
jgi:DNA-dependent protein kinase catalytic subunit